MKKWLSAFIIMGELLSPDLKLLIQDYRLVPGFDFQLELVSPEPDVKIIADCQSFINGVHGHLRDGNQWLHQWAIPVSEEKCDALARQAIEYGDHAQDFCLMIDLERQEYAIELNLDRCL
ncbi:MAG: hypothetical protein Fur0010_04630 [Bdellovibrio sp.]